MMGRYRTVIVGFGAISDSLGDDARMARHFAVASHAQALAQHPRFDWCAVVDPSAEARERAAAKWKIPHVFATVDEAKSIEPDVAVLAMPPAHRVEALNSLPRLKGIVVEKPLGAVYEEAHAFAQLCRSRKLVVQVNLFRRADALTRRLAEGDLTRHIGRTQALFGLYGRGFHNIAPHVIDLARMLLGEPNAVRALAPARPAPDSVIPLDVALPFCLEFDDGVFAMMQPLDFRSYREAGLDIWGSKGRLSILQEGLGTYLYPVDENRGLDSAMEVASDRPTTLPSTYGHALSRLYDNFADALDGEADAWSPLENALRTESVMDAILASAGKDGMKVALA